MTVIGEHLWIEHGNGAAHAHRVVLWGKPRLAVVGDRRQRAVPIRFIGSTDERLVPASEVTSAAPLTDAEEKEYARLDRDLAGTIGEARTLKRFNALRLRSLIFGGEQ